MDELALIRLFIELTGESDGAARCVLMYLEILERDSDSGDEPAELGRPGRAA
jgi:hypothetical protein